MYSFWIWKLKLFKNVRAGAARKFRVTVSSVIKEII